MIAMYVTSRQVPGAHPEALGTLPEAPWKLSRFTFKQQVMI